MEPLIGQGAATGTAGEQTARSAAGATIMDSDTANFSRDVLEASMQVPVIVDFWATWCGPCKTLTPILAKVVTAAQGAVRLVKIDVDKNQQLAQQLRIQSVPTVYAFFQGRPIDAFAGALPESEVKTFVDRLIEAGGQAGGQMQEAVERALEQAKGALEAGESATAAALYRQVLEHDPENAGAIAGMIRVQIANNDLAGAREIFESLEEELQNQNEIASAGAAIALAEESQKAAGNLGELEAKVARSPEDLQARLDLAIALNAVQRREEAAEQLLEVIRRDRDWNDQAARSQLVKFFEAWGHSDPVTQQARRRLSSLLFA